MPEKKKKVFVAEDFNIANQEIVEKIESAGHIVVGSALSLSQGLQMISQLEELDFAALDGDIPADNDGKQLAEAIIKKFPHAVIIFIGGAEDPKWDIVPSEQFINLRKPFIDALPQVISDPTLDIQTLQNELLNRF